MQTLCHLEAVLTALLAWGSGVDRFAGMGSGVDRFAGMGERCGPLSGLAGVLMALVLRLVYHYNATTCVERYSCSCSCDYIYIYIYIYTGVTGGAANAGAGILQLYTPQFRYVFDISLLQVLAGHV